jgi:hypothetical protein
MGSVSTNQTEFKMEMAFDTDFLRPKALNSLLGLHCFVPLKKTHN